MQALARRIRQADSRVVLVFLLRWRDGEIALSAMRAGANDLLTEGSSDAEIGEALDRAAERQPALPPKTVLIAGERMVGRSQAVEALRRSIQRVAASDSNVLITGETGTGKELAAELIHQNSRRRGHPFVSINCAAIPEGLLESELFGYERGAFTGAHAAREGKLQYAQGGTLFLDEVGDMNLYAQAKILRVIESRKVQRLGANRDVAVNIRIIAATNQNIEQITSQQKFRQDLYFRLNVARLHAATRLERQVAPILAGTADMTGLVNRFLLELPRRKCWTVSRPLHSTMYAGDVPGGTLVFRRSIWASGIRFPDISLAEDAAFLREALWRGHRLARVDDDGGLFLYVRHGANTWQFEAGTFINPAGWSESMPPSGFSPESLDAYAAAAAAHAARIER